MKAEAGPKRAGRAAACAALLWAVLAKEGRALAEPGADDRALATTLFQEGRALMAEGQLSAACPKLEESHRLDPGGGTILNLALCHEQEGKLARAWSEFSEAVAFARRDRRGDREAEASEHVSQLEPRLSRLTLVVPERVAIEGFRVERDGREINPASWSLAMPVDGGPHVVNATAPGHWPFTTTIDLPREGGAATVEIPPLALAPALVLATAPAAAPTSPPLLSAAPAAPPEHEMRRTAAWIVGGAGLAQLAVAGYFGLHALTLKSDGKDAAAGPPADLSTALTITGLVTTGVGAYLFLTSRRRL